MLSKFTFVFNIIAATICLIAFLSISLFAQTIDEKRIGVCNAASESKPIEIESESPNYSVAYPTLSEAFYAINQGVHTGEIYVEICFDSTEREAAILLSQETEKADYSRVLIRPLKDGVTVAAKTGYNAMIALNGTDNVTIDGDNPNTAGENRNLTFKGWGGRSVVAVQTRFELRNKYDGASNNTLKNLNIFGNAVPSYGIAMGGHNPGSNGFLNHNNAIINCKFRRVRVGIFSGGNSVVKPNIGTIISRNDLAGKNKDRVRLVGIQLEYESKAEVTDNLIGGLKGVSGDTQDRVAIRLGGGRMSSIVERCTRRCYRSVSNSIVARNIIAGIEGGDRQSVAGIYIYGYKNSTNTIQNNVITGVIGKALTPNILAGIFVAGWNNSETLLYHNSVSMTGEYGSEKIHNPSYAVIIWGEDISVSMFNNIFLNIQTMENNPWAKSYVGGFVVSRSEKEGSPFGLIESNNNIFYSNGSNYGFMRVGSIQRREGSEIRSLGEWQKTSANDLESLAENPLFVNPENSLLLQVKSPAINRGKKMEKVKMDVTRFKRKTVAKNGFSKNLGLNSKSRPDIGAYEWRPQ